MRSPTTVVKDDVVIAPDAAMTLRVALTLSATRHRLTPTIQISVRASSTIQQLPGMQINASQEQGQPHRQILGASTGNDLPQRAGSGDATGVETEALRRSRNIVASGNRQRAVSGGEGDSAGKPLRVRHALVALGKLAYRTDKAHDLSPRVGGGHPGAWHVDRLQCGLNGARGTTHRLVQIHRQAIAVWIAPQRCIGSHVNVMHAHQARRLVAIVVHAPLESSECRQVLWPTRIGSDSAATDGHHVEVQGHGASPAQGGPVWTRLLTAPVAIGLE